MTQGYFIAGTDTGVGKTFFSAALLHHLNKKGLSTVAMKPIAAGCIETENGWVNEDVEALLNATSVKLTANQICPYLLSTPIAPHIAAEESNVKIDLELINNQFVELTKLGDAIVVEGAGGFRVPINDQKDMADLAAMIGLPIILVVGMRLGCLNHALLTADSIRAKGLSLAGWVANQIDPNMERIEKNIEALEKRLVCPLVSRIPFLELPDASHIKINL